MEKVDYSLGACSNCCKIPKHSQRMLATKTYYVVSEDAILASITLCYECSKKTGLTILEE